MGILSFGRLHTSVKSTQYDTPLYFGAGFPKCRGPSITVFWDPRELLRRDDEEEKDNEEDPLDVEYTGDGGSVGFEFEQFHRAGDGQAGL